MKPPMRIEFPHVPQCANEKAARRLLESCLTELHITTHIEDREGEFPSPTILVDGVDVMGAPPAAGAMCRLDVPMRERLLAALRR